MIWLISDTHFNHAFLIDQGLRLAEFDRKIWKAITHLSEDDVLYHLGDVSIGDDLAVHERFNEVCPAKHRILVRGNHDQHGHGWFLKRGWTHICDGEILDRFGRTILLTHCPVELPHWINVNIHGHIHTGVHRSRINDGKHVNISCEVTDYKPITLASLLKKNPQPKLEELWKRNV